MKLEFLPLDKLFVDPANMRHARKDPDVSDLLPSVRARGVLQTLLVRPAKDAGCFGVVAGRRRLHAARLVATERAAVVAVQGGAHGDGQGDLAMLPCAILEQGDDAAAIEASLIENLARLDPDEVTQWATFTRLVREGRAVDEIAGTFGLPELVVRRVLALGNLLPRIRHLYAREAIDRPTVRQLTLASKRQQRDWLALFDDPDAHAPTGHRLKAWLFGGQAISAAVALFDVEASGLVTVADLFGEDRFFVDTEAFWAAQNHAVETRRAAYLEAGWGEVVLVPPTVHFQSWEYEKTPKRKGGRVYVDVRATGEVVFHEGLLPRAEARKAAVRGGGGEAAPAPKPVRPELTSPLQTYIDLHRHAAVRAGLLGHPQVALRLMVAHAIAGSHLWRVQPEPQSAQGDAARESVETCRAENVFDETRRRVLAALGFAPDTAAVVEGRPEDEEGDTLAAIFWRLLDLPDARVMDVVAVLMGESLAAGSAAVAAAGTHLCLDMADWWQADAAFFEGIRDREVLIALVADVAGEAVAAANAKEKGTTLKRIIVDYLDGTDGRVKRDRWVPRWMAFPPSAYTARGGVGTVRAHALAEAARGSRPGPAPTAPGAAGGGAVVPGPDAVAPEGLAPDPLPLAA